MQYRNALTPVQQQAAYNAGRIDAAASLAKEKTAANEAAVAARNANLYASEDGSDAGLVYDAWVQDIVTRTEAGTIGAEETHLTEAEAQRLSRAAKLLGVRVRFADQVKGGEANAQLSGAEVLVEKNNPNPLRFLLGHEWTHRLQALAPEQYRQFRDAVAQSSYWEARAREMQQDYAEKGVELSYEEALDEAAADYAGRMLEGGKVLDEFIERHRNDRTLLQKVRDAIRELIRRLRGVFSREEYRAAQNAERKLTAAYEAAVKQAEERMQEIGNLTAVQNSGTINIEIKARNSVKARRGRSIELETMENNRFQRLTQFHDEIPLQWYAYTDKFFYLYTNWSQTDYSIVKRIPITEKNRELIDAIMEEVHDGKAYESRETLDTWIKDFRRISRHDHSDTFAFEGRKPAVQNDGVDGGKPKRNGAGTRDASEQDIGRYSLNQDAALATDTNEAADSVVRWSLVTDPDELRRLEQGRTMKVYRAMQLIDGKLYPPMAAKVAEEAGKGKKRRLVEPTEMNAWYRSDERPDLADENGMFTLDKGNGKTIKARYNPYFHTSGTPLNDQFSSAYDRPNLVTVEVEIPVSELTSGYRAKKAKDAVGEVDWHSGPVASKLKGEKARRVFLSRWAKVTRIVPDSEVARVVADTLRGEDIAVPANTVTPSLRAELEKLGVVIEGSETRRPVRLTRDDLSDYLKAGSRKNIKKQEAASGGQKVILTSETEIEEYISDAIDGKRMPTVAYGKPVGRLITDAFVFSDGEVDIDGDYLELVSSDIEHAYNEHSVAKESGDIPLSMDDFLHIPEYLDSYDDFLYVKKHANGTVRLAVAKDIGSGKMLIIETVSKSRGAVQFKTAFGNTYEKYNRLYGKQKKNLPEFQGGQSPTNTLRDGTSSKNSVPETASEVKPKFSLKDSVIYNRTVVLKESTVDRYLKDYASSGSPKYAQAYIVRMSPRDFISLTTSRVGRILVQQQTGELDMAELQKANVQQPMQLRIDTETGEVIGHEGRHRATALGRAGVNSIPVLLFDGKNKYSKTALESLDLTGQDFGSSRSDAAVTVRDVQPLSYANRDTVIEKFATQPKVEQIAERYGHETVRYSLKTSRDLDERAALREENEALRERLEFWKGQVKRSDRAKVDARAVRAAAKELIRTYGATARADDISADLEKLYDYISHGKDETGDLVYSEVRDRAYAIAEKLIDSAVQQGDSYREYEELRKYLRTMKFVLTREYAAAARTDSETPNGIFFKDNDHDIGIGGSRQMAVYLAMKNPLYFANREAANRWYQRHIEGYAALQDEMKSALRPIDDGMGSIETAMFAEGVTDDQYAEYDARWNEKLEEMRAIEDEYRIQLRELLNRYFLNGNSEYDGIILDYDGHRYVDGKRENVKSYIVFDGRQVKSATDNTGIFDPKNPDIRYSISEIEGQKRNYGKGVILDTDLFNGVKPRNWDKVLSRYVYQHMAGSELTMYDEDGNAETVFLARMNDRVTKDGARNSHRVIDKLARAGGNNIKALAIVHLSELLETSGHETSTDEHSHQWMDENGWTLRTAYIEDAAGNIYEATLNIANGRDRRILYDISNIRRIDKSTTGGDVSSAQTGGTRSTSRSAFTGTVAKNETNVKQNSISEREQMPKKAQRYLERAERALERRLGAALGVPVITQREELRSVIREISDEYLREGTVSREKLDELFEKAYDAGIVVDREFYDQYKEIKHKLRTEPVTCADVQAAERVFPAPPPVLFSLAQAQFSVRHGEVRDVAARERAGEQLLGHRVLHAAADHAAQRPRAVHTVKTRRRKRAHGFVVRLQRDAELRDALSGRGEHPPRDLRDVVLVERTEDDGLVDAVEKLRPEGAAQLAQHRLAHAREAPALLRALAAEAEPRRAVRQVARAHVARHDDHGVLEIDAAALRVGHDAVLQDLQQDVPHVLVRLLDLVEQHDRIGFAADLLGQLAALVIADVARRRADQPRDRVPLHILAHVDADHGVLVAEHGLGQRFAQLRFADAGGPEEQERPDRPFGILDADAAAPDRARDRGHRLVLADDALVQRLLKAQQPRALVLRQARHGNARPVGHDIRHVLLRDAAVHRAEAPTPLFALLLGLLEVVRLDVAQLCRLFKVLRGDGRALLRVQRADLLLDRAQLRRGRLRLHPHAGGRLIHQVDRLVGQKAVVDIPVRELHRGGQRLVGDAELVVRLVARAQTAQDRERILGARLTDGDRLEPALERRVLLNIFAVFPQRRRADDADLAAAQRRLDDVRRVHGALGAARADDGVQLVDEEDHVAAPHDLLQQILDALLKFAAVLRARDHARQIERQDALVQQLLRHVRERDLLREALRHGRLADARLTDEHRVVLRPARKDLDRAGDLVLAPDHRVELAQARHLGQVARELGKAAAAALAALAVARRRGGARPAHLVRVVHHAAHGVVQPPRLDACRSQHAHGHVPAVAQQAQQQVLGVDILRAGLHRLRHRAFHGAAGAGREPLRGRRARVAAPGGAHDQVAQHRFGQAGLRQRAVGKASAVAQQREQQMLAADVPVAQLQRGVLRKAQHIFRARGESFFVHMLSLLCSSSRLSASRTSAARS